jgi:hypothetical protein
MMAVGRHLGEALVQPAAQLAGIDVPLGPDPAAHDHAGRRHAGDAGQAEKLPSEPHRFRTLPAVSGERLALAEAVSTASTGDLWLFRGSTLADRAIQTATNSPVNHVGMAVAIDDLPPLLWHAELGRSLPDVWTGQHQRGVQLHLLEDAVTTWRQRYGQRAWVRLLDGPIARHHEDRLMEVIARFDGKPFPTTLGLVRQWIGARFHRESEASTETIYCAELVAATYQHMGLLPPHRPASWYDPGRFWSGDEVELVEPFRLGGEIPVG